MTVSRAILVILMMAVIGLAVVAIRGESAKAANRVQKLHQNKMELEQKLWAKEMELARLRGPDEIRRRASELGLDLVAPTAPAQQSNAKAAD